ncbi:hypothetical protein L204_103986 [Cryptococcus depauperatus]|nr:hypothetical protein L204_03140 [Cryptococcus depauperatus CBS 7855]
MSSPQPSIDTQGTSSSRPVHPFFSKTTYEPLEQAREAKDTYTCAYQAPAEGSSQHQVKGLTQATLSASFCYDGLSEGAWAMGKPEENQSGFIGKSKGKRKATDTIEVSGNEDDRIVLARIPPDDGSSAITSNTKRMSQANDTIKKLRKSSLTTMSVSSQATTSSFSKVIDLSLDGEDITDAAHKSLRVRRNTTQNKTTETHPFFTKSASQPATLPGSGQNKREAIEMLEETPLPSKFQIPAKIVAKQIMTGGYKQPHSFFTMARSNLQGRSKSKGSSPEPEVLVEQVNVGLLVANKPSSIKGHNTVKPHFLYLNNQVKATGKLKEGWGQDNWEVAFPKNPWPNHLGGYLIQEAGPRQIRRRYEAPPIDEEVHWNEMLNQTKVDPTLPKQICSVPILPFIAQHPAFSSIPSKACTSNSKREAWADRYRPLRAEEVLGNELEAIYLRDWLSVSAVGKQHRCGPRTKRKTVKKSSNALLDGFIVDDIGVDVDAFEQSKTEEWHLEALHNPAISSDLLSRYNEYPPLESHLTNVILLTGPHGAGKTSAVYACADELGWEVFEVYPGMGKRTGAALMGWVGDLGRNHMVPQRESRHREEGERIDEIQAGSIGSFFGKHRVQSIKSSLNQGIASNPIHVDRDDDEDLRFEVQKNWPLAAGDEKPVENNFKQSLILIDEADILFEEEGSFWPAVIALVSESRRPVVLTCHDHRKIPKFQLPVQAILEFQSPPSYFALPYLQAIINHETMSTTVGDRSQSTQLNVQAIYENAIHQKPNDDVLGDQGRPPNGAERIPYFDMRQAITQLQLGVDVDIHINDSCLVTSRQGIGDELEILCKKLEASSFVDAYVDMRDWVRRELFDIDRLSPTLDDERETSALLKEEMRHSYPILAACDRSEELASFVVDLAGGKIPSLMDLGLARTAYIRSTLPILDPIVPLSAPLLPHPSIFLYTLPIILTILSYDDYYQSLEQSAIQRGEERINTKTGKPVRGQTAGYMRWLDLNGLEKEGKKIKRLMMGW